MDAQSPATELLSLGYVGIGSRDLDAWSAFATKLLGMQLSEQSASSVAFRMDDRRQRIVVDREVADGHRYFGWEVADGAALARVAARVEAAGYAVIRAPAALADQRFVSEMIAFDDPAGNRIEIFHSAQQATNEFSPGRCISGFRTGPLGLGHAVLMATDPDAMIRFYQNVLGFRLSDYLLAPFKAYFFHINPRHHSLAIIQSGQNAVHHLMVELCNLDDVGQGYDIALQEKERVAVTLGRHANDYMTSFYARSPSKFMVEYGWGGRVVDMLTWQAKEFKEGPSLWGHERDWLAPDQQAVARNMRMTAAADGIRYPVQVMDGNYTVMPGTCGWWDGLAQAVR
jgi:2,3-dihydroxybiphenyl 1,2-dioxygenase